MRADQEYFVVLTAWYRAQIAQRTGCKLERLRRPQREGFLLRQDPEVTPLRSIGLENVGFPVARPTSATFRVGGAPPRKQWLQPIPVQRKLPQGSGMRGRFDDGKSHPRPVGRRAYPERYSRQRSQRLRLLP